MTDSITDRKVISGIFTLIILLLGGDIAEDISHGSSWTHVLLESSIITLCGLGVLMLWRNLLAQRGENRELQAEIKKISNDYENWRSKSQKYIEGLSNSIDEQLTSWELTPSEQEVARLVIKGLSNQEIADIRSVAEKTVRTQVSSILAKSQLKTRGALSAFFLEDLLLPESQRNL
jgi:DNA-binding CsgD family transcriptional regulator